MAGIPRCCGSGLGQQLQLRFNPQPGNLHMLHEQPKEIAKRQKNKKSTSLANINKSHIFILKFKAKLYNYKISLKVEKQGVPWWSSGQDLVLSLMQSEFNPWSWKLNPISSHCMPRPGKKKKIEKTDEALVLVCLFPCGICSRLWDKYLLLSTPNLANQNFHCSFTPEEIQAENNLAHKWLRQYLSSSLPNLKADALSTIYDASMFKEQE